MRIIECHYKLVDVFAEAPLTGNPTAVVTDARGLSRHTMQAIAAELNQSRTTFVFPGGKGERSRMATFSPWRELTGHVSATIGVAYVLSLQHEGERPAPPDHVVLEGKDGPVSVSSFARVMTVASPLPELTEPEVDVDAILATLGLSREHQLSGAPILCGRGALPYLLVPLRNRQALMGIGWRQDIWERAVRDTAAARIVAYTLETERVGSAATMRVFSPGDGLAEEVATEEACGPVAAHLLRLGLVARASPQLIVLEQGATLDRPSYLHVAIERDEGSLTSIRVGGTCVLVGEGALRAQQEPEQPARNPPRSAPKSAPRSAPRSPVPASSPQSALAPESVSP